MKQIKFADRIWEIYPKKSSRLLSQILINRKIPKKNFKNFISPNFNQDLHDPFLMLGMDKAVERILKAVIQKEKIGIFADFDADGISGCVLLCQAFKKMHLDCAVYLPSRLQGYGLNQAGIDYFVKEKVSLIITVDCGIRDSYFIEQIKKNNIDVIITDHHEPADSVPDCIILDPKQKNDRYPFSELAGAGVVYKLICGIAKKSKFFKINDLKWMLDLVAIATITDVVPLVNENRILAKYGLIVCGKTRNIGLKMLLKTASIEAGKIDSYKINYQIGPRINAPGRIDHANYAFKLLTAKSEAIARKFAKHLEKSNQKRQQIFDKFLKIANGKVEKDKLYQKKLILITDSDWPAGIVGLIASKIAEKYSRPAIIIRKGKKECRGSARSIEKFNLVQGLSDCSELLIKFGGHKMAAGLTIDVKNIKKFYQKILSIAEKKLKAEDLLNRIKIDAEIQFSHLNFDVLKIIKKLEPYGMKNPKPTFLLKNAKIIDLKLIGEKQNHLKFKIYSQGKTFDVIAFGVPEYFEKIQGHQFIDLVFYLDENIWNGTRTLQLKLIDFNIR
jgi:single-stranded-DNA-specific exonuclease